MQNKIGTVALKEFLAALSKNTELKVKEVIRDQEALIKSYNGDKDALKAEVKQSLQEGLTDVVRTFLNKQVWEGSDETVESVIKNIESLDEKTKKELGDDLELIYAAYKQYERNLYNCITDEMLEGFIDGSRIARNNLEKEGVKSALCLTFGILILVASISSILAVPALAYLGAVSMPVIAVATGVVPFLWVGGSALGAGLIGERESINHKAHDRFDNEINSQIDHLYTDVITALGKEVDVAVESVAQKEYIAPTQEEFNAAVEGVVSYTQDAIAQYPDRWPDEQVTTEAKKTGGINLEAAQRLLDGLNEVKDLMQALNQEQSQGVGR